MKAIVLKYIIGVLFCLTCIQSTAQQHSGYTSFATHPTVFLEDLYLELRQASTEQERFSVLNKLAEAHIESGNTDSILYYGQALIDMSTIHEGLGSKRSLAYWVMAAGARSKGLNDDALTYHLQGIKELESPVDSTWYYRHRVGIGALYLELDRKEEARLIFNTALQYEGSQLLRISTLRSMGQLALMDKDYDLAYKYNQEALVKSDKAGMYRERLNIQISLAQLSYLQGNLDASIAALVQVKDQAVDAQYYDIYLASVMHIGNMYRELGDPDAAEMVLSTAFVNAMQWDRLDIQQKAINQLRLIKAEAGDYENAYNLMTQYTYATQRIQEEQNAALTRRMEAEYGLIEQQRKIFELESDRLRKESEVDRQRTIKNAILIGFLILLVPIIALIYTYYQKIQAQSRSNAQQEELNREKLTSLMRENELESARAAMDAQRDERARIARELHDSIGGNLAGIKLRMAETIGTDEKSKAILSHLDETYEMVRDISHDLVPKRFSETDFSDLIEDYITKLAGSNMPVIEYRPYPRQQVDALDETLKAEVFKVIQELLTNSLKHAEAELVEIHLSVIDNSLQLLFEDDGLGYDTEVHKSGIGLANIADRVTALRGEYNIDSSLGRGTAYTMKIPIT